MNLSRGRASVGSGSSAEPLPSVGWVPADLALNAFGGLVDNPWGPIGELRLTPDPETLVEVDAAPGRLPPFRFVLADATTGDGHSWHACPRAVLRRATQRLADDFGLQLRVAVEHEFAVIGAEPSHPFSVDAARRAEPLLSDIAAALDGAGLEPEQVLPEFGRNQFELTIEPATGVAAADRVVMTREIIREVARAGAVELTFAPMIGIGAGSNGAHLHLSLLDRDDRPVTGAADRPLGLSDPATRFAAGIMTHLPALTALTAPSAASYLRLRPRSWSSAFTAVGVANREAALRIGPGRPEGGGRRGLGPSLELRSCDATANPYLAIAGVIAAGIDGLCRDLQLDRVVDGDPADLSPAERAARGIDTLPQSLDEALDALECDDAIRAIFGPELDACWFSLKRAEAERFRTATPSEIVEAYVRAY